MKNPKAFDAAYIRLTLWYVAIIMAISLLFSAWVYNQARNELRKGLNAVVEIKKASMNDPGGLYGPIVNDRLADSRDRLIGKLVVLNAIILVTGAAGSYVLARRTMQPIEDAVEAQERFTADASHELRTPLAAMKSEIEVGLRGKLSKEDAVALLESNLEEVNRLGGLAEGLLALTQYDPVPDPSPLQVDELAAKVVARMRSLALQKQISMQSELDPVMVQGNEIMLDKIVGILLDNAIKYSPAQSTITVRTYQQDGYAHVAVQDTGYGIKAGELPHIFERFYRADSSRSKERAPGHGLGLSIAKKLADSLDAKIFVTSHPGKGSTFTCRLPLA